MHLLKLFGHIMVVKIGHIMVVKKLLADSKSGRPTISSGQ